MNERHAREVICMQQRIHRLEALAAEQRATMRAGPPRAAHALTRGIDGSKAPGKAIPPRPSQHQPLRRPPSAPAAVSQPTQFAQMVALQQENRALRTRLEHAASGGQCTEHVPLLCSATGSEVSRPLTGGCSARGSPGGTRPFHSVGVLRRGAGGGLTDE